jgi:hypothetical protein
MGCRNSDLDYLASSFFDHGSTMTVFGAYNPSKTHQISGRSDDGAILRSAVRTQSCGCGRREMHGDMLAPWR